MSMKTNKPSCNKCVYYLQTKKSCDGHMLPDPVEPDDVCDRFVADLD